MEFSGERLLPIMVLMYLMAVCEPAKAGLVQVAGNLAVVPNGQGQPAFFDVSNGTNPVLLSIWPTKEAVGSISLYSRYATLNEGAALTILDINNPANPHFVNYYTAVPRVQDLQVVGRFAYLAKGSEGFTILDLIDPEFPLMLGSTVSGSKVFNIHVVGDYLYAAGGEDRFQIFDVSDPISPRLIGAKFTVNPARYVRFNNGFAYVVCDDAHLEIVDVQDPFAPVLAGRYDSVGNWVGLDVSGMSVFLADTNGSLTVLNVANSAAPSVDAMYLVPGGATGLRVIGDRAYIRNLAGELVIVPLMGLEPAAPSVTSPVANQTGVVGQTAQFSVVAEGTPPLSYQWNKDGIPLSDGSRVRGATSPHLGLADLATADAGIYSVTVTNAVGETSSFNSLSVVALGTPVEKGSFIGSGPAMGLDVVGDLVYALTGSNGFEIFNVASPRNPVRLGGALTGDQAIAIKVRTNYAFIAVAEGGLKIFDLSNESEPVLLNNAVTTNIGTVYGLDLHEDTAYLASGENGLQIIDVSRLDQPTLVGGYDSEGVAYAVQVVGDRIYLADGAAGLKILSSTNSRDAILLGGYATVGEARSLQIVGNTAYVADSAVGLLVLDVQDPSNPMLIGSFTTSGPIRGMEIIAGMAVLSEGANGVEVVGVANPTNLVLLAANPTITNAAALRLQGTSVYLAAGDEGYKILKLAGMRATEPLIESHPKDEFILPGQGVTLRVSASGQQPLSFQWFKNDELLFEDTRRQGVSTDALTLAEAQYDDSAIYSVVVKNGWNLQVETEAHVRVVPIGTPVFQSAHFDPGDVLNIHVVGQLAFVANRLAGLQIIDCGDPNAPVLIGQHPTSGFAQDVRMQGHFAYVAVWEEGIDVFDILDPSNPVKIGHCNTPGFARGIDVSGELAYVADYTNGLQVIDVHDPSNPRLLGQARTRGFALDVRVAGTRAYVAASQAGLEIFDISDPLGIGRIGELDTPGEAESLEIQGNLIYLADYDGGLLVIDVSDAATPQKLGHFQTQGDAFGVNVIGDLAYVAEGVMGVEVVNVSNPTNLSLALIGFAGDSVHSLQVSGKHAFLADRITGLIVSDLLGLEPAPPQVIELPERVFGISGQSTVISVATAGTPPLGFQWFKNGEELTANARTSGVNGPHLRIQELDITDAGEYSVLVSSPFGFTRATSTLILASAGAPLSQSVFDTPGDALNTAVSGQLTFIADGTAGVSIVDASDPLNPLRLSTYAATGNTYDVWVRTNLLFLAKGTSGLEIVDIGNPFNPYRVGGYDTPGTALGVHVVGEIAYVADGSAGLQILGVTNPTAPTLLGEYRTTGTAKDVQIVGNMAFIADGNDGLQIIDVSDPSNPIRLGGFDTPGSAEAVRILNNRAYLANGAHGLVIIDVGNPADPTFVGSYPVPGVARGVDVVENWVILTDDISGYLILDVSNPSSIVTVGGSTTPGSISGVTIIGNMAYLAGGSDGLRIVELTGLSPLAPGVTTHPIDQIATKGGTVEFHSYISGSIPIKCRWYHNDRALFNDAHISGATTAHLKIANLQRRHAGRYELKLWNNAGIANSETAILTFIGPLQSEINTAEAGASITLPRGVYEETLVVDKDLTLVGNGPAATILDGVGMGRVVHILSGASVKLRGMTLRNGSTASDPGGAILNEGLLVLDDCLIVENCAGMGGGLANLKFASISYSTISSNVSVRHGGGIFNGQGATLEFISSSISNNGACDGGGIYNIGDLNLTNSTIAANRANGTFGKAGGNGGALYHSDGVAILVNCTISGNEAVSNSGSPGGLGGGIHADAGRLELRSTTLSFNQASRQGGGVMAAPVSEISLRNSILARNTVAGAAADSYGLLTSEGYNLVQTTANTVIVGDTTGNQIGIDPRLGPLKDNGGPTWTHALLSSSPAIDAGAIDTPTADQRGVPRPIIIDAVSEAAGGFDIGAFERVGHEPLLINYALAGERLVLSWQGAGILQSKPVVGEPWEAIADRSPVSISVDQFGVSRFFRLLKNLPPPVLSLTDIAASGFTLSWTGVGIAQRATTPDGPWKDIGGPSPFFISIPSGTQGYFYRIKAVSE